MGRGPDKHILKKLVRKYFKFDINRNSFNTASQYYPQLIDSWSKKGMFSQETKLIQSKIDEAMEKDEEEYRAIKKISKNLPYELNQMMYKTKSKYAWKGRQKQVDAYYFRTTKKDNEEMEKFYRF